jgi:hypothetical protein
VINHLWSIGPGVLSALAGLFAWLKAREVSRKADTIIINVNGRMTQVLDRNHQLATELTKHGLELPPPIIKEDDDEGHS